MQVDIVGNDQLTPELNKIVKAVNRLSRTINTQMENIVDAVDRLSDAASGIGPSFKKSETQAVSSLKKINQEAAKASANISSTGGQTPLADKDIVGVNKALAQSQRAAAEEVLDIQRRLAAEEKERQDRLETFISTKRREAAEAESAIQLDKQRQAALKEQERAQLEYNRKLAIANTLRLGEYKEIRRNGKVQKEFVADVSRVTPEIQRQVAALPRLRYALYDVSQSFARVGAALGAAAIIPAGLAIRYEREFADVIRTTGVAGQEINKLRSDFVQLKQEVPISWADLTDIGTLAGQLGIANNLIAGFTESVAKFAATTDLSVEAAATAFGRLNELIDGVNGQFDNLGSAILKVGIESVATESQIVAISTQIASIANVAGFTADEVIGLSGALASLGIRPELARGTVTRLFTRINRSVSQSGRALDEFGRLTNQTAEDFANAWQTAPAQALVGFLQGIDQEGTRAERTLAELGITSVRDVPALLRLAQNTELVTELLGLSADAYAEGTEIQEQYSIITSTTAERLKVLSGNFELLLSTIGQGVNFFTPLIEVANRLLIALTNAFANPVIAGIFAVVGAVTAVTAVLALTGSVALRAVAGLAAFKTSMIENAASATTLRGQLLALNKSIAGTSIAGFSLGAAFKSLLAGGLIVGGIALISAAITSLTKATRTAQEAAEDYFGTGAQGILTEAIKEDTAAWEENGQAIATRAVRLQDDAQEADAAKEATLAFAGAQREAKGAVDDLNEGLQGQVVAFGDQSFAALQDFLIDSEQIQQLANSPALKEAFTAAGGNFSQFIKAGLAGDAQGYAQEIIQVYAAELSQVERELSALQAREVGGVALSSEEIARVGELSSRQAELATIVTGLNNTLGEAAFATDGLITSQLELAQTTELVSGSQDNLRGVISFTNEAIQDYMDSVFGAANLSYATQDALYDLGEEFFYAGEQAFYSGQEMQSAIAAILAESGDANTAIANLAAFMQYLGQMGVDVTGPAMEYVRDTIFAVGQDSDYTDAQLQNIANGLFVVGDAGIYAGDGVQYANKAFAGQTRITPPTIDFKGLTDGFNRVTRSTDRNTGSLKRNNEELKKTAENTREVREEVRTLLDYAGDLRNVITRAFDIRFATILQIDKIADAWQSVQEKVEDAREAIAELKAEQEDLGADRAIKEYFLSVAESYGDMLRAAQLRKEIAELDAKQAQNARDLSVQQQLAGGDLSGTEEGARQNRSALLSLVQQYQEYITTLAESGASQEELRQATARARQEFIAQATELGFQEQVVLEYAQAFDDVTTAIDGVPRNITVEANVNPALQALNELRASLQQSIDKANELNEAMGQESAPSRPRGPSEPTPEPTTGGGVISIPSTPDRGVRPSIPTPNIPRPPQLRITTPSVQIDSPRRADLNIPGGAALNWRPFASGGYTGPGGKYQPAGIVHKGEYVVPKQYVNQSTGLPSAGFLAQLQNGMRGYAQGGFVGGMGAGEAMMVELSPYDRKLLADAGNVQLRLNGRVVAEATNASNYNEARRGSN